MAETEFILSRGEQKWLLELLSAQGVTFVPCLRYRTAKYLELTDAQEILDLAESGHLAGPVLVLSQRFSVSPPRVEPIEWQGETRYFIQQRQEGPYFDFLPCWEPKNCVPRLLRSGFLAHYPTYYLDGGRREIPAPPELKALYRSITGSIRRRCVKFVMPEVKRTFWVGPEVIEACRHGLTTNVPGLEEFARQHTDL